ncbi:MAG: glycoside hydrolase family 31 protein [Salibacteraceae bacterium]|nr:glycoside hydrolase family 31 protein [Salibacteraceae bacterium]
MEMDSNVIQPVNRRPQEQFPTALKTVKQDQHKIYFTSSNNVILCVQVVSDYMVRFRYCTEGFFDDDFSYAIYKDLEGSYNKLVVSEKDNHWEILTKVLRVTISKTDMKVAMYDANSGMLISSDEKGFHWEEHPQYGGNIVMMSKAVRNGEHYFGVGDKPMQMNLRGRRVKLWGTDEYGFAKDKDPLYKNIPFYTSITSEAAYGVFFDNTFESYFDFASERKTACSFWAHGGEMNYYFIYGPTPMDVVERYSVLTGKPELPPMWALGFHQCKWSYYPEQQVRDICNEFRTRQIPCDAIYLDIDYMDGFRCFTWDKEKFPEPKKMIADLDADGFKTVVIIDPGIKIDPEYSVFKEGFEKGYFCKRADGDYMKGKVWPGDCYFVDFTMPEAREWWAGLFKELIAEQGVRGVWNDMNEPAVMEVESKTFPPDVRHDYDGHPSSHRKAHNVYGMQMARATYHGVKDFARPNRPFIITRSLYSGTQRYSATWTGDNIASWEHLWVANVQCQRMSVSGHSFIGSDIGGFTEHPSSELFVRWIQLGLFHPMMRVHNSGDHGDQEPWSFSEEATAIVKKFIELRYILLPYMYTTFWQHATAGTPMLRPLAFVDHTDPNTLFRNEEFLFGDHVLVCPIVEQNATSRYMYLPRGDWYNYFTREQLVGGKEIQARAELDEMPIFVRGGAIIPNYPIMQYVGEKVIEQLTLQAYYSAHKVKSQFYEDAGDGYDYKKGISNHKTFTQVGMENSVVIRQSITGKFSPSYSTYHLQLIGLPFEPRKVFIDEIESEGAFELAADGSYNVIVPTGFELLKIEA